MARPVTLFTGQWADLPLEELAAQGAASGSSTASSWPAGATTSTSPRRCRTRRTSPAGASSSSATASSAGRSATTSSARRSATRSTSAIRRPAAGGLGRRRPRGRAPAGRGADEGHRPRRRAARRRGRHRLHRLVDLAHALLVPAQRLRRRSSAATRTSPSAGARSSTSSTPRACASRSRSTRPRSPTTSSPRARRSTRSTTARASASTSTRATSSTSSSTAPRSSTEFADRIYHVHVKDSIRRLDGRSSILGGHLNFGEAGRGWDFVSPGHGDVDFEALFRALNRIGYEGPLSVEWEDSGMDRDWGAPDALAFVRRDGLRAVDAWRSTRRSRGRAR